MVVEFNCLNFFILSEILPHPYNHYTPTHSAKFMTFVQVKIGDTSSEVTDFPDSLSIN